MKVCIRCNKIIDKNFNPHGMRKYCSKECKLIGIKEKRKRYNKTYRIKHKEKIKEIARRNGIKNKDKIAKRKREYYYKNRERFRKYHRKKYLKNRGMILKREKLYREKHEGKLKKFGKEYYKEYYANNKERLSVLGKKYRSKNIEKRRKYAKQYRINNRERLSVLEKGYRTKNVEKRRKTHREYYQKNINYRLSDNLRVRIRQALKNNSKLKTTKELIGCSIEELKRHLEKQFTFGMNWKNHGFGWHIDHIKPCCSFDLSEEEEQKRCFHYTNLQPLWATENIKKGTKSH